jgi:hypothetical protein
MLLSFSQGRALVSMKMSKRALLQRTFSEDDMPLHGISTSTMPDGSIEYTRIIRSGELTGMRMLNLFGIYVGFEALEVMAAPP